MTRYFAHSTKQLQKGDWQPLRDHLVAVAELAAGRGAKFRAEKAGGLAGLLHDIGKYTDGFQRRLSGGASVDHASAGAQQIRELARSGEDRLMAELVAYAIAGHHTGLPDREGGEGCLSERLAKKLDSCDPVWRTEITPDASGLLPGFKWLEEKKSFQFGVLGRMIFSCLIDADRRDTEAFYARTEGRSVDRSWAALPAIVDGLIAAFDRYMAATTAKAASTPVNALRAEVLSHVRGMATLPQGLFTLTVPTGGGKTLASLGFALDHAKTHGLDRIVYAIPFTSIIDQTAAIFRAVLGPDHILEHHSAIEEERATPREGRDKLQLAMEDWAAPIVVTTNVQLFESLFANRTSRCRKLHNLARSVIVLDEAQTIPLPVLRPCIAMLDELARNYGTSIVLCTATQPALAAPKFEGGFAPEAIRELAPDPHRLHRQLKRVTVRHAGELNDDELVIALKSASQALVIVNSRAHALALYRMAAGAGLDGVIHLTTRQYAAHRRVILDDVRKRLKAGEPCRLIATSLVEAGVDLDFPAVWRAEAGLDQIAQAAGRCNREGGRDPAHSIVTVFRAVDHKPPREIELLAGDMGRIAGKHEEDLLSLDALRDYFGEVYWRKGERLDAGKVLVDKFRMDRTGTGFAYRTVAENFRLIESGMLPVIIARNEMAQESIKGLSCPNANAGKAARELQTFIVQVPPKARSLLISNGHVRFVEQKSFNDQFAVLITDSLYTDTIGLLWENADYIALENGII